MPSKSLIFKLFLIAVIICCLTTSTASGAKITKPKTKSVAKPSEEVTTAKSTITHDVTKADNDNNDDDEEDNDDTSSEESDDTAEKNAVQPGSESSLSVWGIVRGVWNWIRDDISAGFFGGDDDDTTSAASGN